MTDHHSHTQTDSQDEAVSELKGKEKQNQKTYNDHTSKWLLSSNNSGTKDENCRERHSPCIWTGTDKNAHFMREFLPLMKLLSEKIKWISDVSLFLTYMHIYFMCQFLLRSKPSILKKNTLRYSVLGTMVPFLGWGDVCWCLPGIISHNTMCYLSFSAKYNPYKLYLSDSG